MSKNKKYGIIRDSKLGIILDTIDNAKCNKDIVKVFNTTNFDTASILYDEYLKFN